MNSESPHLEKLFQEMLLALTPDERVAMVSRMYDEAKELIAAGVRMRMPHANEAQIRAQVFLQMYGGDFTREELANIKSQLPNMQWDG